MKLRMILAANDTYVGTDEKAVYLAVVGTGSRLRNLLAALPGLIGGVPLAKGIAARRLHLLHARARINEKLGRQSPGHSDAHIGDIQTFEQLFDGLHVDDFR
jgi:hypothetical protein